MPRLSVLAVSLALLLPTASFAEKRPFPKIEKLPVSPDVFCRGFDKVFAITTQDIKREVGYLCQNGTPSDLLRDLVANPYKGDDQVRIRTLLTQQEGKNSRVIVAFSTKIPEKPLKAILTDEKKLTTHYFSKTKYLDLTTEFGETPVNNNDADTVFTLNVTTKVRSSKVNFDDTAREYLKFYRMHPNNFDYFFAARTLIQPTPHSIESNTIRGYMPDPNDSNATLAISVFNFLLATPSKQHEALVEELLAYSQWFMSKLYY